MPYSTPSRLVFVSLLGAIPASSQLCSSHLGDSPEKAQAYLALDRQSQDQACTADAIAILGRTGSVKAIAVLGRYLDFVNPGAQGILILENNSVTSLYPSAKALVGIGRRAMPILVEILKRPDEPYLVRGNAGRVIRLIYDDDVPSAIALVLATRIGSEPAAQLLQQAALWLVEWCSDRHRSACERAYNMQASRARPRGR